MNKARGRSAIEHNDGLTSYVNNSLIETIAVRVPSL